MPADRGREVVIVEAVRTPIGRGHKEKGYYKDTHPERAARALLHRGHRARRDPGRAGRGRDHRLRAAVRRADVQRRPQRLAAGRASRRDPGHHGRPPVRLGPAGGQLRRRADRRRRPRRRHRLRRRAHGPHPDGRRLPLGRRGRQPVAAGADGALQPDPPGPLGRDDRRPVGDPALRARRARASAPTSSRTGRPRRAASSARSCRCGSTATPTSPTRGSGPTPPSRRCPSSSRRSRRTARSPRATARRSPTAPPPCC